MKTFFYLSLIVFSYAGYSQDCKNLYYLQNNKTIEMTMYNNKGNENGRQVYSISDVHTSGTTSSSTVNTEMLDKSGKPIAKASGKIECTAGVIMIDMKMFFSSEQIEQVKSAEANAAVSYLEYPPVMKVGDRLKDGQFNINAINNGITTSIDFKLTDRFVEAKEKITSAAGSWDAFKISYNSKIKMKIAGIGIPVNSEISEWYAPDFGIVKTETKNGSTIITAIH